MIVVDNDDHERDTLEVPKNTVCTCVRRRNVPRAHGYANGNSIEEYGSGMVEDQGYICYCTVDGIDHSNLLLLDSDIDAGYAVRVRAAKSPKARRLARKTKKRSGKHHRNHTRHANRTHH